jgi:hypothetical protein
MNRSIILLGALLGAQLILALLLAGGRGDFGAAATGEPLLSFDPAAVDRIAILGGGQELQLQRVEGQWRLPQQDGLPASGTKVQMLLDQLAGLQQRHPVATSAGAAARFKVDAEGFERKLVLNAGDQAVAQLYLGDSPGYRRSYLRREGEEAVYEGALAASDAATEAKAWGDPALLHLEAEQIAAVTLGALALERREGQWHLEGLGEGEQLVQEEVETLLRRLANLAYLEAVAGGTEAEEGLDQPALRVGLRLKDGVTREYLFGRQGEEGDYLLQSSAHPWRFKVANFTVDPLRETDREKLVKPAASMDAMDPMDSMDSMDPMVVPPAGAGAPLPATGE